MVEPNTSFISISVFMVAKLCERCRCELVNLYTSLCKKLTERISKDCLPLDYEILIMCITFIYSKNHYFLSKIYLPTSCLSVVYSNNGERVKMNTAK